MHINLKKKTFVLIVAYLAAAIAVLIGFAVLQSAEKNAYRRTAQYGYSHAFCEVVQSVEALDTALKKGQYATGNEVSAEVCAQVCGSCQAAQMTMAALPFSTQELERTAAFVSVAEDYGEYLLKTVAGEGFSDTERENFAALAEVSEGLKNDLSELQKSVNEGSVLMDSPEENFAETEGEFLSEYMLKAESALAELPSLDYNGSFEAQAAAEFSEPLSEEAAKAAAEEFFGVETEKTEFSTEGGVFCFAFEGGTVTVDAGGNVLSMSSNRAVAGDTDSPELIEKAKKFLDEKGFENMVLISSVHRDSVLTAEFAGSCDGVICENDCIRVSVAADDGSIYAFDATDYYNHCRERTLAAPAVTEAEAKRAIPESLTISDCTLMLCDDNSLERLCYVFDCLTSDGNGVRICVDAATGTQFAIRFFIS